MELQRKHTGRWLWGGGNKMLSLMASRVGRLPKLASVRRANVCRHLGYSSLRNGLSFPPMGLHQMAHDAGAGVLTAPVRTRQDPQSARSAWCTLWYLRVAHRIVNGSQKMNLLSWGHYV